MEENERLYRRTIEVKSVEDDTFKIILEVELNRYDREYIRKEYYSLALFGRLKEKQLEVIEKVYGYEWYKKCIIFY